MTLHPAVAAVRGAVRRGLADLGPGSRLVVACSGGPDSLALLAATVFEGRRAGWHVVGATVDHGLQEGSADHAAELVRQMAGLGVAETVSARVSVRASGQGPEAAAREARYAVLEEVAQRLGADAVLLGHTRDDQAETVLLGLARGSGTRSLAGMPARRGLLRSWKISLNGCLSKLMRQRTREAGNGLAARLPKSIRTMGNWLMQFSSFRRRIRMSVTKKNLKRSKT